MLIRKRERDNILYISYIREITKFNTIRKSNIYLTFYHIIIILLKNIIICIKKVICYEKIFTLMLKIII